MEGLLNVGDYLVFVLPQDAKAYVTQVKAKYYYKYGPWNVGLVNPQSYINYTQPKINDKDPFEIETPTRVLHVKYGIYPSKVRAYLRYPRGTVLWVLEKVTPEVAEGTPAGYVTGEQTPYDNPRQELFVFKNIEFEMGFYNPTSEPVNVKVNFIGAYYDVRTITDDSTIRNVLQEKVNEKRKVKFVVLPTIKAEQLEVLGKTAINYVDYL